MTAVITPTSIPFHQLVTQEDKCHQWSNWVSHLGGHTTVQQGLASKAIVQVKEGERCEAQMPQHTSHGKIMGQTIIRKFVLQSNWFKLWTFPSMPLGSVKLGYLLKPPQVLHPWSESTCCHQQATVYKILVICYTRDTVSVREQESSSKFWKFNWVTLFVRLFNCGWCSWYTVYVMP